MKIPLKGWRAWAPGIEASKDWHQYIKGDKEMKHPKWLYEIVAKHLQCSIREDNDAVEMYEISAGGQAELADILGKYGVEQREIRKLGLIS